MNFRARIAFPLTAVVVGAALVLAGCGKNRYDATPVVATVNGENVTQGQIDYVRSQYLTAHPGASAPENAQILKGLVEQRLLSQKAEKDKLDRNPGVLQSLEAARKDALVRFYMEQVKAKVPKPTPDEIKQFYDGHPQYFAQRNIYMLQRVDARVTGTDAADLARAVQATSSAAEAAAVMKFKAAAVNVTQAAQPAESLGPLLPKLAQMKPGQTIAFPQPTGIAALTLIGAQSSPVTLEQATPRISSALWNQRTREALQAEAKALRSAAKIEYLGAFAASAPGAAGETVLPEAASEPASEAASEPAGAASQ
jgi:EpsD family peptidyl-prolyl cis-trans isomerase